MNNTMFDKVHRINYLVAEMDAMYHKASLKVGLVDSTLRVLYTIYDNGESCLLSDVYKQSGISKQTVNSAIRNLEKDEILYLEKYKGRSKKVCLTEKGKMSVKQTVARIYEAESKAFVSWTEDEINIHIHLLEKYVDSFRQEIEFL